MFTVNPHIHKNSANVITWYHLDNERHWIPGAPTFENVTEGLSIETEMGHRRAVLRLSCDYWTELEKLAASGSHEELLEFHQKIYNLELPKKNVSLHKLHSTGN